MSTIKSKDIYSLDSSTDRPFKHSKLRILREGVTPLPLRHRLPSDGRAHLDSLWTTIVKPEAEVETAINNGELAGVTPYCDATLRYNRDVRIAFFKEMASVGLVGYQTRIHCRAAPFLR